MNRTELESHSQSELLGFLYFFGELVRFREFLVISPLVISPLVISPLMISLLLTPSAAHSVPLSTNHSFSTSRSLSSLARKGRRLIQTKECNRCHAVTDVSGRGRGVAAVDQELHCVNCHRWILSTKHHEEEIKEQLKIFPMWRSYLEKIVHFTELPDLGTLARRVHPNFIRRFLAAPFDLRPHLEESMIPAKLSKREISAIVAYMSELNGAPLIKTKLSSNALSNKELSSKEKLAQRVKSGRQRFIANACPTCHLVGNERFVPEFDARFYKMIKNIAKLAPNLRYVRERIPRSVLIKFIMNPQAVDPQSKMPRQKVTLSDAESIADFLLGVSLSLPPLPDTTRIQLTPIKRQVSYEEVKTRVFGKICVHCHMNKALNNGQGGPGNSGGLGFSGVSLDLETYAGIQRGVLQAGRRISLLTPKAFGQEPYLVEVLLRRHREAQRDQRPPFGDFKESGAVLDSKRLGMPLGLPALPLDDIALIKAWIESGAPGPIK